jgi:hypothetical protein
MPLRTSIRSEALATERRHGRGFELREEQAFREGLRAFAAGLPWVHQSTLRYLWTNVPRDRIHVPFAAVNRFWHMRRLADARLTDGGQPNNDTPYTTAWLDLSIEPMILSHRDMGSRFFAFDLLGMGLEPFASIGSRLTGPAGGAFAIRGPDWHGLLPRGVVPLPRAPSNSVLLIGRTACTGARDLPLVHDAQSGYRLVPLSRWPDLPLPPESRAAVAPVLPHDDPLGDWKTMNRSWIVDPPGSLGAQRESWAHLGVGAGLLVEAQPEPVRRGLARAAAHTRRAVAERAALLHRPVIDGWVQVDPPTAPILSVLESAGWHAATAAAIVNGRHRVHARPQHEDAAHYPSTVSGRGGLELTAALAVNPVHAPVEYAVAVDADGLPFLGGRSYRLRFRSGALPPVRYFWSLTLYGLDGNLVHNIAGRSSVVSVAPMFRTDPDGGVTVAIGPTPPAEPVNWLPGPIDRRGFYVVLRLYAGDRGAIASSWRPPGVVARRAVSVPTCEASAEVSATVA